MSMHTYTFTADTSRMADAPLPNVNELEKKLSRVQQQLEQAKRAHYSEGRPATAFAHIEHALDIIKGLA